MEERYQTLFTIYKIVKDDPTPESYKCRPRELILRQLLDWSYIQKHLNQLEKEGLVVTRQQDTLVINITRAGIEKILLITKDMESV